MTYEQMYRKYYGNILWYMNRKCNRTYLDPLEVTHDVFLRAWKEWPNRMLDNITGWLYHLSKRVLWRASRYAFTQKKESAGIVRWDETVDARSVDATQEDAALIRQLESAIMTLPEAQRYAMEGAMQGLNNKEIAAMKGNVTHQAIAGSLKTARQKLLAMTE